MRSLTDQSPHHSCMLTLYGALIITHLRSELDVFDFFAHPGPYVVSYFTFCREWIFFLLRIVDEENREVRQRCYLNVLNMFSCGDSPPRVTFTPPVCLPLLCATRGRHCFLVPVRPQAIFSRTTGGTGQETQQMDNRQHILPFSRGEVLLVFIIKRG